MLPWFDRLLRQSDNPVDFAILRRVLLSAFVTVSGDQCMSFRPAVFRHVVALALALPAVAAYAQDAKQAEPSTAAAPAKPGDAAAS